MSKRILDEATASNVASDDYLYIDGATNGSRKITPENIVSNSTVAQNLAEHISEANETITEMQANIAADHAELVDEITALKEDLENLETTEIYVSGTSLVINTNLVNGNEVSY